MNKVKPYYVPWLLCAMLALLLLCAAATAAPSPGPGWRRHAGLDCSNGHGAVDLEQPPGSSLGAMPLARCLGACRATPNCTAVVTDVLNVSWSVHRSVNCYAGRGAAELIDGQGTVDSCSVMTLPECRTQCLLTAGCTGAEYNAAPVGGGNCCLRANITLAKCDQTPGRTWDLHELVVRKTVPADARSCRRRADVVIGECDGQSETSDTFVVVADSPSWWLTTNHYAERSFMPRHYSCDPATPNATCTLRQLQAMLPDVQAQGYSVVNVDWPVESGPDSLYEGYGAKDFRKVDPALGTTEDWLAFVSVAHGLGLRVIADFNPSYFWTGAPAFKQAVHDVKKYGVPTTAKTAKTTKTSIVATATTMTMQQQQQQQQQQRDHVRRADWLPPSSPARWFRWLAKDLCPDSAPTQPDDDQAGNGVTNGWVRSPAAGGACYYSIWGNGQPCGDLGSAEWAAELTGIIQHWATEMQLDGFMLDAPGYYLITASSSSSSSSGGGNEGGTNGADPLSGLHDAVIAETIRRVIVDPAHAAGAAVFGETYNLLRPPHNKVLDGGRNTDMADGTLGFPGKVHAAVISGDASGLEALLQSTVDVLSGWSGGGAVRTEPDSRGPAAVAGLKAAVTALLGGGYYVVRFGPDCASPYPSWHPKPGDQWPSGCFGKWAGADAVAQTLRAAHAHPALRPGTPRRQLEVSSGGLGAYAALRWAAADDSGVPAAAAVVAVFNFAATRTVVGIQLSKDDGVAAPQQTQDLLSGGSGPAVPAGSGPWMVPVEANGWRVIGVGMDISDRIG